MIWNNSIRILNSDHAHKVVIDTFTESLRFDDAACEVILCLSLIDALNFVPFGTNLHALCSDKQKFKTMPNK